MPKNPKAYLTQPVKVVAPVSLSPALSALLAGSAGFIWLGTKLMKNVR